MLYIFLVFTALLLGSGVFSHLLSTGYLSESGRLQISLPAKVLLGLSYLFAGVSVFLKFRDLIEKISTTGYLWILTLSYASFSILWGGVNVSEVINLFGFLGCSLLGGMLFVSSHNSRRTVELLYWVCLSIVFLNVYYLLFHFDLSKHWLVKGFFFHKNQLGHYSFLALFISAFVIWGRNGFYRWLAIIVFWTAFWLLFLSKSMTSYLLVAVVCAASGFVFMIRRFRFGWFWAAFIVTILLCLSSIYSSEIINLLGRSVSFSERIRIWKEFWALIQPKLIFGYGYATFPDADNTLLKLGSHNGYIDVIYHLGLLGLGLISTILVFSCRRWWVAIRNSDDILQLVFLGSFLVAFLALNVTETYMLNRSGLFWPLFIYCTLQLDSLAKRTSLERSSR